MLVILSFPKRLSEYYIVNQIVPIYVLVLVSLVTYTHNPSKVETRVALNLTCFLALTAIKVSFSP